MDKPPHLHAVDNPKEVIDVGRGTGYCVRRITQIRLKVTAADLSAEMLTQAKQRCGDDCHYLHADAEKATCCR